MKYSRKFRRNSRNVRKYRGGDPTDGVPAPEGDGMVKKAEDAATNAFSSVTDMFKGKSENSDEKASDSPGMFDSLKTGVSGAFSSVKNIIPGSTPDAPTQGGRRSRRSKKNRSRKNRRSRR